MFRYAAAWCLTLTAVGCGSDGPSSPPDGPLVIAIATTGDDIDANGYDLVIDGTDRMPVPSPDTTIRLTRPRGTHEIRLEGLARNCVVPANPTIVSVTGTEIPVVIAVTCRMRQIAYIDYRDGDDEIYLSSLDGGPPTQLTNNSVQDGIPTWSPDGERLTFASERDGNSEIYVMNADGTGVQRLTNDPARDVSPRWSPDGTQIAFLSYRAGEIQLFVMHADGSNVRQLTHPPGTAGRHRWSADGSLIGFSLFQGPDSGAYLFTIRPDGTDRRQLTFKLPLDVYPRQDLDPTWSPDGTRIAFSSNRFTYPELFVMNADGTNQVQLTRDGANGFVTLPAWSIDGKRIAYTRHYAGVYTIWLWDVAEGRSIPFVSGPQSVLGSAWRP